MKLIIAVLMFEVCEVTFLTFTQECYDDLFTRRTARAEENCLIIVTSDDSFYYIYLFLHLVRKCDNNTDSFSLVSLLF